MSLRIASLVSVIWLASAASGLGAGSDWAEKVFRDPEDCFPENGQLYYDMDKKTVVYNGFQLSEYVKFLNDNIKSACETKDNLASATLNYPGTVFGIDYSAAEIPVYSENMSQNCEHFVSFDFVTRYKAEELREIIYKKYKKRLKIYKTGVDRYDDQGAKPGYIFDLGSKSLYVCNIGEGQ